MLELASAPIDPHQQAVLFYLYAEDIDGLRDHLITHAPPAEARTDAPSSSGFARRSSLVGRASRPRFASRPLSGKPVLGAFLRFGEALKGERRPGLVRLARVGGAVSNAQPA